MKNNKNKEKKEDIKNLFSYRLLKKYSSLITEKEEKSISDLKLLINPEDPEVKKLREKFITSKYSFEENYLESLKKIHNHLLENIREAKLDFPLTFWLSTNEMLKWGLADDEDLAIFLCSLMLSLGDKKAMVYIVELSNLETRALVFTEYKNTFFILDPFQKESLDRFKGERDSVIASYAFGENRINRPLFAFNRDEYKSFI